MRKEIKPVREGPFLSILVVLLSLAGCDSGDTNGTWEVEPGLIWLAGVNGPDSSRVEVNGVVKSGVGVSLGRREVVPGPATVPAGMPIEVEVHTLGTLPRYQIPASSEVTVAGNVVRIAVRDSLFQDLVPLPLTHHPRTEAVVFSEPGEGWLVIEGIRSDLDERGPYVYEFRIPIQVTE